MKKKCSTPLYIHLSNLIRSQIISGEIKPGDKLISETEMVDKYGIGRLTIREALSVLVNEGLLKKHHGKGTFCVATPSDKPQLRFDVLLDIGDVYFIPYYLRSICKIFEKENCDVIVNDTKDNIDTICEILNKIIQNGSDGVIIQPSSSLLDDYTQLRFLFSLLEEQEIPYIMLDGIYKEVAPSYVVLNEFKAGKLAAKYFLEHGHNNLCMVTTDKRMDALERQRGFESQLETSPHIVTWDLEFEKKLLILLQNHPEITGIFCYNDLASQECYNILLSHGYNIPDDISIISMDDTVIASTITPTLTSVSHPKNRMGKSAAQALLDIKNKKLSWPYQKTFESSIIQRDSVKSLNN